MDVLRLDSFYFFTTQHNWKVQVVMAGEDGDNMWFKQYMRGQTMARNRSCLWFCSKKKKREKKKVEYISQRGAKGQPDISCSVLLTFKRVFVLQLSGAHQKVVYQFCAQTMFFNHTFRKLTQRPLGTLCYINMFFFTPPLRRHQNICALFPL